MRRLLAYLTVLLAALACKSEWENDFSDGMDPRLEGKPVTVTFSVPDVRIAPATKSLEDGDGDITGDSYLDPDKLYLVICGHSQSIKYIRKAEMVVDGDGNPVTTPVPVTYIPDYPLDDGATTVNMYTFTVQLELSDGDRTIHFLGNVDEDKLMSGSYSYQLLPTLMSGNRPTGRRCSWSLSIRKWTSTTSPLSSMVPISPVTIPQKSCGMFR